jgi:hypothetical protein
MMASTAAAGSRLATLALLAHPVFKLAVLTEACALAEPIILDERVRP